MTTKNSKKTQNKYNCEKCDFYSNNKNDYKRHLQTKKHNTTNTTKIQQKNSNVCECGKSYPYRASLYNHKKHCKYVKNESIQSEIDIPKDIETLTNLVTELVNINLILQTVRW